MPSYCSIYTLMRSSKEHLCQRSMTDIFTKILYNSIINLGQKCDLRNKKITARKSVIIVWFWLIVLTSYSCFSLDIIGYRAVCVITI